MASNQSLANSAKAIASYVKKNHNIQVEKNNTLLDIYSGLLLPYIERSLSLEIKEKDSLQACVARIAPINLLIKIVDKLSQLYSKSVNREWFDEQEKIDDTELYAWYVKEMDLNNIMSNLNVAVQLGNRAALEPYISDGKPGVRVLTANLFMVYSDDDINPLNPTVFIKMMGKNKNNKNIYYCYSDLEFMVVDEDGEIQQLDINPYGKIPFIYVNSSRFDLMPIPDLDSIELAIVIPKLLTDLNFGVQYCSRSVTWMVDCDTDGLSGNPGAVWSVKSISGEQKTPQIGTITPSIQIAETLNLIQAHISFWLDTKGLKSSAVGQLDQSASGLAKMVDNADATNALDDQKHLYKNAEHELWELLATLNNIWIASGQLTEMVEGMPEGLECMVIFPEQKPITSDKELADTLTVKLNAGLISKKRAIKLANPDLNEDQIEELIQEIEDENKPITPPKELPPKENIQQEDMDEETVIDNSQE